jgi:hypothetical protein
MLLNSIGEKVQTKPDYIILKHAKYVIANLLFDQKSSG